MKNSKTITLFTLAVLYRIAIKRIAKNLSPAELSFLIGRSIDFVNQVELLQTDFYTPEDIRCIATALEEENLESYYPLHTDETVVKVIMEKEMDNKACIYSCSIVKEDGELYSYFTLKDDFSGNALVGDDADFQISVATDALQVLIKTEYFYESQLAVQVYLAIRFFLLRSIHPAAIKEAFLNLCLGDEPLLEMVELEDERLAFQQS